MSSSHRITVTVPSDEMLAVIEKRAKANGLKLGTYFLHLAAADCGRHGEWPVAPDTQHGWQLVATLAGKPGATPWSPDSATTPDGPE